MFVDFETILTDILMSEKYVTLICLWCLNCILWLWLEYINRPDHHYHQDMMSCSSRSRKTSSTTSTHNIVDIRVRSTSGIVLICQRYLPCDGVYFVLLFTDSVFFVVLRALSNEMKKSAMTSPSEADDVVFHVGHETVLRISARKESNTNHLISYQNKKACIIVRD